MFAKALIKRHFLRLAPSREMDSRSNDGREVSKMHFYLVGDFNNWRPDDPRYRFKQVRMPYGRREPNLFLTLGSYCLETSLPSRRIRFKIVQDGTWDHQWSVRNHYNDVPCEITKYHFTTRHGLKPCHIGYRGGSMPPHAEFEYPGKTMRWDFHPDSQTVTIHNQINRSPGPQAGPWKSFPCGKEAKVDTWYCLPYGYDPKASYKYPLCLMFDGRGMLYGDWQQRCNYHNHQWPRVLDTLARHGVITPVVLIAIGIPKYVVRKPQKEQSFGARRKNAYIHKEHPLHKNLVEAICRYVVPRAEHEFCVSASPNDRCAIGHSNGGDMAIALLAEKPEFFHGAVAISLGAPGIAASLSALPARLRERLRIGLSYTAEEPTPNFMTRTARVRGELLAAGIQHLVQYFPEGSHDPTSVFKFLPGCLGFVVS